MKFKYRLYNNDGVTPRRETIQSEHDELSLAETLYEGGYISEDAKVKVNTFCSKVLSGEEKLIMVLKREF